MAESNDEKREREPEAAAPSAEPAAEKETATQESKAEEAAPPAEAAKEQTAPDAEKTPESTDAEKPAEASSDAPEPKSSEAQGKAASPYRDAPENRDLALEPAKPKRRDWLLALGSSAMLFLLMSYRGDVQNPHGDDPLRPLGHYASLLHSGHIPGAVFLGAALVFLAVVGFLGVLGDSPLDLRGDEAWGQSLTEEEARPWYKREGAWIVGFCFALYLPMAGAFGLWDPWETHYGEVAREILARDDWITLWWGQEGWFMSKPILIFWMDALGMSIGSTFGMGFWADSGPAFQEWCIRVPIALFATGAVYATYKCVAMAWGRRAGSLSAMVLATVPHFAMLSHQAMTDMPFVAPLIIAMCFLIMACIADPQKLVRPRRIRFLGRDWRVSLWHLAVGALLLVSLPQIIYLLSRPVLLACPEEADRSCQTVLEASRIGPLQWPIERYWYGSAANSVLRDANSTVPGSPAWEDRYNQIPFMTSFVQGLLWAVMLAGLLWSYRRERKVQPLYFALQYLFAAISFMGKGPAGLGVPEIVLLGFMMVTGKWHLLRRIRLLQGIAIYLVAGFPWYIAIYCRLGNEFTDRFVVHDLLNRTFAGVHGDTGTFRYFIWQMGYGLFPWTGLAPVALGGWKAFIPDDATEQQKDVARLALLWFLVTFTLFSLMVTKFHHYIFPAEPSIALLVGLVLHRMLGARSLPHARAGLVHAALVAGGVACMVLGISAFLGPWHGELPRTTGGATATLAPGNPYTGVGLLALGLGLLVRAWRELAEVEEEARCELRSMLESPLGEKLTRSAMAAAGLGAAVCLGLVARDIGWTGPSRPTGSERFIHLFIYNYDRTFPTRSVDYHPILTGFGVTSVVLALGMAAHPTRRLAARGMLALGACFCFWALDKYMIDLSNHWSQRNLFARYYQMRSNRTERGTGEDARYVADPMVAFQMNWKGENFYTGNHAAMLECGLPLCRERTPEWLRRHHGQRVFFVTEHSRAGSVASQVRQVGGTANNVTDEYDNNKFVLIEAHL